MNHYWIYIPFVAVIGYFAYRVLRSGGIKAALFGARIVRRLGEIEIARSRSSSSVVRVHELQGQKLGIERTDKAFLGFSTMVMTLTRDQACQLAELIRKGTHDA